MPNSNQISLRDLVAQLAEQETDIRLGGGQAAIERQHKKGRITARERIEKLIDPGTTFFELGLWAAWGMYTDYGGAPAAGVVTGIGTISGRRHMIIANDATVKAGAFFPATAKKVLRAQRIAVQNRLPIVYLVDSAGIFLPLQEDVFPDEDDFGRIFRNNAVISAMGLQQTAAIMGNCVAGGGYLPVLCDKLLMTEGSGLYLAGPALVKSAIGQEVSHEALGGAAMHAQVSGTIDYRDPDDDACLARLRRLAARSGLMIRIHGRHFDASDLKSSHPRWPSLSETRIRVSERRDHPMWERPGRRLICTRSFPRILAASTRCTTC